MNYRYNSYGIDGMYLIEFSGFSLTLPQKIGAKEAVNAINIQYRDTVSA